MKNAHPVITLLGNNSGRNLGDATILSGILERLSKDLPDAEFLVPSISPEFIDEHYRLGCTNKGKLKSKSSHRYNVKGINVMPYTGSIRLLGIPTMRAMLKSDVALICDGIIFGHKLFSIHNFLITLIFLVPWSWVTNCKLVAFCCGIGPFPSKLSRLMARFLLNNCDFVSMRELESKALAEKIGVKTPVQASGDAAFFNPVNSAERGKEVLAEAGIDTSQDILGINITPYIDDWLSKDKKLSDRASFLKSLSAGFMQVRKNIGPNVQLAIFSCSPMDEEYSRSLGGLINAKIIDNSTYLSHDIQAAMAQCGLLVGMRFHSLVLASAVEVPIVGLIYAPKVRGYFSYLNCSEFALELKDATPENLSATVTKAWNEREVLKQKQQQLVKVLRSRADKTASELVRRYYPEYVQTAKDQAA